MQKKVTNLAILGSTGSIGCQVLDIVRTFKDRFNIVGLAAGDNITEFTRQVEEFAPRFITCNHNSSINCTAKFLSMEDMASHRDVDMVIVATTGKAGLQPTLAALKAGKITAIANKEILVMAGDIITSMATRHKAIILPIDSEHSAVWQCLQGEDGAAKRLLLTASGGPFFGQSQEMLAGVTVKQALDHPTWKMGKKVTLDSATLFNKGMEAMEAHWLFDIPYEKIEILVHRQSIVHSMVEFADGSIKAQLSTPDMRLPIQYALFYPERVENSSLSSIDFSKVRTLTFEPVNFDQFPCLKLALEAARKGGTYPAVLCAADEIAVQLFLENQIKFTEIASIIETTLNLHKPPAHAGLDEIVSADAWARETALKAARKGI
jgi:1-deoxy-D-xylulose-5-phosphate reductoisomerase